MSAAGFGNKVHPMPTASRPAWIFDVDGCLVDSLTGTSLRPGTVELLTQLRMHGTRLVLWSAGGLDYARRRAEAHGVDQLFDAFGGKDQRDAHGRYRADHLVDQAIDAVFVDDRPEDLPLDAPVVAVHPYLAPNAHDRGLDAVLRAGFEPLTAPPDRRGLPERLFRRHED